MDTKDIVLLAVTLLILGEVSFLLAKLPKTTMKAKGNAVLVDTSVLMDGRITGIAATGFIGGTLVIPRSVVGELQFLADNADADKRARARRGLDVVTELQHMPGVVVELLQDGSKANEGVDERLLSLAKQYSASICTIDYNLNKVAVVEGIKVLNINELAQSIRMAHLPGDQMVLEIVQKGQDSHQGVAYLPDGTMVVVEQSSQLIGQQAHVEIVRSLQTAAGKMMFAKRVDAKPVVKTTKPPAQTAQKAKSAGRQPRQPKQNEHTAPLKQPAAPVPATPRVENSQRSYAAARRPQQQKQQYRQRRKDHESSLIESIQNQ